MKNVILLLTSNLRYVIKMFRLFFTPEWFNGWDVVFNIVGLVIALIIAGYSWRVYRIHKENKYAYFSLVFVLVAISLFFNSLYFLGEWPTGPVDPKPGFFQVH